MVMGQGHPHAPIFPPLYIVVLCFMLLLVFLTVYQCIVRGCCRPRPNLGRGYRRWAKIPGGLENSMLQLIPISRYTVEAAQHTEAICAVCLCQFKDGEDVRVLPGCRHSFHVPCIDMWLFSHANCPLCRTAITVPSGRLPP
uniref:RING-type E3 ubiquitin transferase n=1 Tax=Nelumbo nucifera TaxID=4432 RepID=A0A822Y868_NELNU|nr:TPA_asm: hypothetical protein HUJ06_029229 [Nelumbo nucifera]